MDHGAQPRGRGDVGDDHTGPATVEIGSSLPFSASVAAASGVDTS